MKVHSLDNNTLEGKLVIGRLARIHKMETIDRETFSFTRKVEDSLTHSGRLVHLHKAGALHRVSLGNEK